MSRPVSLLLAPAVIALACLSAPLRGAAEAPRVQVQLAPDPVGLDELATLTLRVDSQGFQLSDVEPKFDLEDFSVAAGPFRSQSQSWVNGVTSSTTQLVWQLQPRAVGTAKVLHIQVLLDGVAHPLHEAALRVVEHAPATRRQPQQRRRQSPFPGLFDQDPFGIFGEAQPRPSRALPKVRVHSLAAPSGAWVGEQIDWRLVLDTQTDISGFQPREIPDFHGFWARDVERPDHQQPEWIQESGERFGRVIMMERLLYPLRPGNFEIRPLRVDVVARQTQLGFFSPLARDEPMLLRTEPIQLTVRPLPAGAPPNFAGVVGPTSLIAQLDRSAIATGGAANLTLTADGPGHLQGIAPPALEVPSGLRAFPPSSDSSEKWSGGRWMTTVRWRYVVVADRAGTYRVPAASIPYFDPATASYRSAASSPLILAVTAAATTAERTPRTPAPGRAAADSQPSGRRPVAAGRWTTATMATWVGLALLGGAGIATLASRRRPKSTPLRQLRDELQAARRRTAPRDAAQAIEAAWRAFLAARYELPRSLPRAQWANHLVSRGVEPSSIEELESLFADLRLLEYAPELSDVEGLRSELLRPVGSAGAPLPLNARYATEIAYLVYLRGVATNSTTHVSQMVDVLSLDPKNLERFLERRRATPPHFPLEMDLAANLAEVLRRANEFVPSQAGSILLDDPRQKSLDRKLNLLTFLAVFGERAETLIGKTMPANRGIAGHVYRTGRAYFTSDAAIDPHFDSHIDRSTEYSTRSLVAIPIRIETEVCGVLELLNRQGAVAYGAGDRDLLEIFAGYISISIQNVLDGRLAQEYAKRDNLTGLFNDRFLHSALEDAVTTCLREDENLSVLFLDLDYFKLINDTHGHLVGSQVLREVGELLNERFKAPRAIIARYGGDEFVIARPGLDAPQAFDLAERMRVAIVDQVFCTRPGDICSEVLNLSGLTCSIGVSTRARTQSGGDGDKDTKRSLLREADAAMYRAKSEGRNRVALASHDDDAIIESRSLTPPKGA